MATEAKVIEIDGSSSSGKGTLAKSIAEKLNWRILDSGAIYRVIGLVAERYNLLEKEQLLIKKIRDIEIQFLKHGCFIDDEDVSEQIRTEEMGKLASTIAAFPNLRSEVLGVVSEYSVEQVEGKVGRDELAESIKDAINQRLEELEGFGGVEGVYFTSFVLQ